MAGAGLWTDRRFKPHARHRRASAGPEVQPYQPLHLITPVSESLFVHRLNGMLWREPGGHSAPLRKIFPFLRAMASGIFS